MCPMDIEYTKGYLTEDVMEEDMMTPVIVAHICNDVGKWGAGFTKTLSGEWPEAETHYRVWYQNRGHNDFRLGSIQHVSVGSSIWVVNMVAQMGVGTAQVRVRYWAVEACLKLLSDFARACEADRQHQDIHTEIHMPKIGCGLGGGDWDCMEPLIQEHLVDEGTKVIVHEI